MKWSLCDKCYSETSNVYRAFSQHTVGQASREKVNQNAPNWLIKYTRKHSTKHFSSYTNHAFFKTAFWQTEGSETQVKISSSFNWVLQVPLYSAILYHIVTANINNNNQTQTFRCALGSPSPIPSHPAAAQQAKWNLNDCRAGKTSSSF